MAQCTGEGLSRHAIIQGGMGIGVSSWRLARAVSRQGQIGVVSGTALSTVLVRRLQDGDPDGSLRRALLHCPLRAEAEAILSRYWIPDGRPTGRPYRMPPLPSLDSPRELTALTIVANFAEVFLAKEGHTGVVGINLLEKLQIPTLPSLFGAMLAGVDCVLMGAGIPSAIPGTLDQLAVWNKAELRIAVDGIPAGESPILELDPADYVRGPKPALSRPVFLAIVSSSALATMLARKASGRVDGFIIEGYTAGGHNAPPRGPAKDASRDRPVYGPRDVTDLGAIRALGLPFWLAGSYAHPDKLAEARAAGAAGVQIGTAFALCEEAGLDDAIKRAVIGKSREKSLTVATDGSASPTGMPFKVVALEHTLSEDGVYQQRTRKCDLGYLRQPYRKPDGTIGYRCPAEPEADYVRKGGDSADTVGRKCLCNGLLAAIGLGQTVATGVNEPAIVTAGEDVVEVQRFAPTGAVSYSVADVLRVMLAPVPTAISGS
jgi:nitronate monooxygenase